MRVKHGNKRAPLLTLVNQIEHVAGVATEPVESRNDQLVTGPEEHNGGMFGAGLAAVAVAAPRKGSGSSSAIRISLRGWS